MLAKTTYWCLVGNEGMIHNPSNPQQPIHSLRLAPVGLKPHFSWRNFTDQQALLPDHGCSLRGAVCRIFHQRVGLQLVPLVAYSRTPHIWLVVWNSTSGKHTKNYGKSPCLNGNVDVSTSGWWFGTMEFYDFPYIGNSNPNWNHGIL